MNKVDFKTIRAEFAQSYGRALPDHFEQKMQQSLIKFSQLTSTVQRIRAYADKDTMCDITISRMLNSLANEGQFQRLFFGKRAMFGFDIVDSDWILQDADMPTKYRLAYETQLREVSAFAETISFVVPMPDHVSLLIFHKAPWSDPEAHEITALYADIYPGKFLGHMREQVVTKIEAFLSHAIGRKVAVRLNVIRSNSYTWQNKCQASTIVLNLAIWFSLAQGVVPKAVTFKQAKLRAIQAFVAFLVQSIHRHSQATLLSKLIARKKLQVRQGQKEPPTLQRYVNKSRLIQTIMPILQNKFGKIDFTCKHGKKIKKLNQKAQKLSSGANIAKAN